MKASNGWTDGAELPAATLVRMHDPETVRDAQFMESRDTCVCKTSRCAERHPVRIQAAAASRRVRHESEGLPLLDSLESDPRRTDVASGEARRTGALHRNRAGGASDARVERVERGNEGERRSDRPGTPNERDLRRDTEAVKRGRL